MLHFIEFHFQQDHKHSNTWMWNTCALLYIYSPIWFYNLLACALKGIYSVSYNATCVATPQKPWVIHVDLSIPPFYGTKLTFTFCYRKTWHIYLTTSWDWVPYFTCKKRMKILQLHKETNMFCTRISLNTKDCEEGLCSVNMVHITLDQICNGNNFKVLEVKDLQ